MSRNVTKSLRHRWHGLLGLPPQSPASWHRDRVREELREYRAARTRLEKLSEAADVVFSLSRAEYDGFLIRRLPRSASRHLLLHGYMMAKFTSRWLFYRTLAFFCGAACYATMREVVNPAKDQKLEQVALRHRIEPDKFIRIGRRLRQVWPLLP
ncbi:hypothetical protein GGR57DRAFT_268489 [Xylariaceae sp. FL1272]|nr:hypothetical protein GGR57DRAFT_268489 [Xylariaceae sp. FL1272]